jgi:hypothetical protein
MTTKRETLFAVARAIANGTVPDVIDAIAIAKKAHSGGVAWKRSFAKLENFISNGTRTHSIFMLDGNSKLPFVAFSALPIVSCPGAGECADWCYSMRAWRYPDAFVRQASNSWMMRTASGRTAIAADLERITKIRRFKGAKVTFRLYVDGDFASVEHVGFWMETLSNNPVIEAYGYSKSFAELIRFDDAGGAWPANYQLNISSGHNHSTDTVSRMRELPITRGEFRAVSIGRAVKSAEHGTPSIVSELRARVNGPMFPCPGKCGTCTPIGHACGASRLKGKVIVIAVH